MAHIRAEWPQNEAGGRTIHGHRPPLFAPHMAIVGASALLATTSICASRLLYPRTKLEQHESSAPCCVSSGAEGGATIGSHRRSSTSWHCGSRGTAPLEKIQTGQPTLTSVYSLQDSPAPHALSPNHVYSPRCDASYPRGGIADIPVRHDTPFRFGPQAVP